MSAYTVAADTSPEISAQMIAIWRSMSPSRKLEVVAELNEACDALAAAGVRQRHPVATEREVELRVFALRLGRARMIEIYGWDPDLEGW